MLNKFSNYIAFCFLRKNIINKEDVEIYAYGMLAILEISINLISTLVLSLILDCILETIGFILIYIPLRSFCGGYHAKRFISCYFISIFIYLLTVVISKIIIIDFYLYIVIICVLFTNIMIIAFAPLESENKPLDNKEKIKYRKISILISSIYSIILLFFIVLKIYHPAVISFSLGGMFCGISLLISKKKGERQMLMNSCTKKTQEILAATALKAAKTTRGITCFFFLHQPKAPDALKNLK